MNGLTPNKTELTKDKLIKYLECVKNLEVSIYSQRMAISKLEDDFNQCKERSAPVQYKPVTARVVSVEYEKQEIRSQCIKRGTLIGAIAALIIAMLLVGSAEEYVGLYIFVVFFLFIPEILASFFVHACWCIPVGAVVGLIFGNMRANEIEDEAEYENRCEELRVKKENKKIEEANEHNMKLAIAACDRGTVVKMELEVLRAQLEKNYEQLDAYYDLDILYPKYRGLVHVCSLYEYVASGRCDGLTGPHGAYNLLEDDIKYAKVVEKMDAIVSNLEQIRDNQNALYYAICEVNSQMYLLNDSINEMSAKLNEGNISLDELKNSLQNIEYNTKISAETDEYIHTYLYINQKF